MKLKPRRGDIIIENRYITKSKLRRGEIIKTMAGIFSYSHSHIETLYNYILNQEEHHRRKTFREEYLQFLREFDVPYDKRYLFEWIE